MGKDPVTNGKVKPNIEVIIISVECRNGPWDCVQSMASKVRLQGVQSGLVLWLLASAHLFGFQVLV